MPQTEHIKLTDSTRLVRDVHSKGLLSTDKAGLAGYKAQRKSGQQLIALEQDINNLRNELKQMQELLQSCLQPAT